jgi:TetR/AcrR family transcriptional regulator
LLRIHVSGIIRNYSRRPCLNKLLHLLLRDEGPSAQVIQNDFVAPLAVAQRTIVERGIAEGRLRPIDPVLAHFIIVGACEHFFTNKRSHGRRQVPPPLSERTAYPRRVKHGRMDVSA